MLLVSGDLVLLAVAELFVPVLEVIRDDSADWPAPSRKGHAGNQAPTLLAQLGLPIQHDRDR